ncbi:MAG: tail fiber domain-containing protein [Alphaproteobacteria bacterium]|nr:tail fiber domain-containing protein [Alphaproteobacteria bacterium]
MVDIADVFSAKTMCALMETVLRNQPNKQSGFMLAPLLYMLALGGIGAAVMFSGYSQVLRSNAEMTAVNTVRQQLNSAGQTLSASAALDSATSTIVQPPNVQLFSAVTDTSRLPGNYAAVNATGTPHDYGVIDVSSGVRQLDPWGKYYVYCRWENPVSNASAPSIMVISGGPDGLLGTKCGDTVAQGDDRINKLTVAEAINRANVWQVNSSSQVKFGIQADAVKVNDDGSMQAKSLTLSTPLAITSGGTGAADAATARTNLSVPSNTGSGASGTWNIDISGNAATATVLQTARNFSIAGSTGLTAPTVSFDGSGNVALALTGTLALANGGTGATTAPGARTNLGSTAVGDALFTAASASAGRGTLGATAIGDALFTAATAAAARSTLGLGTMAVQDASNVAITGGTITGVTISGSTINGNVNGNATSASSVPASGITGVVSIAQGGTGQTTAGAALIALGGNNASNLTTGTLNPALLPVISPTSAGMYNWGTVDIYGRVTAANNLSTNSISQGNSGVSVSDTGTDGTVTISTEGLARLTIDQNGNVGIGTITPADKLDVNGNIRVRGAAGTDRSLFFSTLSNKRWALSENNVAESGSNLGSNFVITRYDDAGTSLGNALAIARNTGAISTSGDLTIGGAATATGGFFGSFSGTFNGTFTGTVAAAGSDKQVQFNSGGNLGADSNFNWDNTNKRLGLGTATVTTPLDVKVDGAGSGIKVVGTNGNLLVQAGGVNGAGLISQSNTSTNGFVIGTDSGSNAAGSVLRFQTAGNNVAIIDNAGKFGIGTTAPNSLLQVNQSAPITSTYFLGSNYGWTTSGGAASVVTYRSAGTQTGLTSAFAAQNLAYPTGAGMTFASGILGELAHGSGTTDFQNGYGVYGNWSGGSQTNTFTNVAALGAGFRVGGGTVTNAYGLRITDFANANNGTLTNTYGVYVGDITPASVTQTNTPFSFYASDANAYNYFAGNVGIGTSAPVGKLDISGREQHFDTSFSVSSAQGSYTEFFDVASSNNNGAINLSVRLIGGGYAHYSEFYHISMNYDDMGAAVGTVYRLLPVNSTGRRTSATSGWGSGDFALEMVKANISTWTFRVRQVGATDQASGMGYDAIIIGDKTAITTKSVTGSDTSNYAYNIFRGTQLTATNSGVGIGTANPAANLDIGAPGASPSLRLTGTGSMEFYRPAQSHWKFQHMNNGFTLQNSWTGAGYNSVISLDDGLGIATTPTLRMAYDALGNRVGINTATPAASAVMDLTSTTKGFLMPRVTTVQRDAIASPATGLMVYNTTTNLVNIYNGSAWSVAGNDGTTAFSFPQGTVTAPGLYVTGDSDTGFYQSSANKLSVTAGGTEVMRWNTLASAVNYFSATPAITGGGPTLAVDGSDTNINMNISPKGTGSVIVNPQAAGAVGLTVKATASQTADLLQIQNSSSVALAEFNSSGYLGIGTTTVASTAMLDLVSTTKGMLIPRMTTVQRNAIATPATGLMVYNTTTNTSDYYNGTSWVSSLANASGGELDPKVGALTSNNFCTANAGATAIVCSTSVIPVANLGTGTPSAATYLRGDGTWVNTSTIQSLPAGSTGQVQFNNANAFAADAAFNWDNTNKRLGIGTATPASALHVQGASPRLTIRNTTANDASIVLQNNTPTDIFSIVTDTGATTALTSYGYMTLNASGASSMMMFKTGGGTERMRITDTGSVGIGSTTPAASSLLDMASTSKGFLPPRMTTAQRDAIASPATGLQIYNSTTGAINVYNGTAWTELGASGGTLVTNVSAWTTATCPAGYQVLTCNSSAYNSGGNAVCGASISGNTCTSGCGGGPYMVTATCYQNMSPIGGQWGTATNDLYYTTGSVGIGTNAPSAKAVLDLTSTTKGFLPPRMTTAQRDAIASPATGLNIFNTTTNQMNVYDGSAWAAVGAGASGGASIAWSVVNVTGSSQSCNTMCASSGKLCAASFYQDESYTGNGTEVTRYPVACSGTMPAVGAGAHGSCLCYTGGTGAGPGGGTGLVQYNNGGTFTGAATLIWDSINSALGIGTATPSTKAVLDLTSTTKGFLPPRMTTAQRDAIASPAAGLQIYNTTTNALNLYNGTSWGGVGGGTLASLTDATITSPANSDILQYNSGTSKWVNTPLVSAVAGAAGPSFSAYIASDQTISASTWTKVTLGTEEFDTNNNFATGRFTPTVAGKYQLSGTCNINTLNSGNTVYCAIYKNGSLAKRSVNLQGSSNSELSASVTAIVDANGTTDYFELYVWSQNTNLYGGSNVTYFTGGMLAPLASGTVAGTGSAGYVPVWTSGNAITYDSTAGGQFAWDLTNHSLGIGTATPSTKAVLDLTSTTKGFLPPRMTTVQRDAIASPVAGLQIYNTTTNAVNVYNGTAWGAVGGGGGSIATDTDVALTSVANNDILRYDSGTSKWKNVNIGTAMSTTTMVANWPDAIYCLDGASENVVAIATTIPDSNGQYRYDLAKGPGNYMLFNADGTFNTQVSHNFGSCNGQSITQLYAAGKAFNFIGSSLASAAAPAGGLQFNNGSGVLAGDSAIIWDNSNKALGIGTATPSTKAVLDLTSTTKGFLPPRMTTAQRDAIASPVAGLQVYNTTTNALNLYNGTSWGGVGGGTLASLTDATITTPANNDILQYNSGTSKWVNTPLTAAVAGASGPSFLVNRNGVNQTVSTGGWTKIQFTNEVFDTNNNFDNTTNYRFTPTVAGKYIFVLNVSSPSDSTLAAAIFKNGVVQSVQSSTYYRNAVSIVLDMNGTTDYVEGNIYNYGGSTLYGLSSETNFSGSLLVPLASGTVAGTGSAGYVPVWTSGNAVTYDSTAGGQFAWDLTNHSLGIGTNAPSTKAVLDLTSTTKGFLPPRMTTAQRDAIASPTAGLQIYNTTTNAVNVYNGTAWGAVGGGGGSIATDTDVTLTSVANNDILRYDSGTSKWKNVNIGTAMSTTTMQSTWPDAIQCYGTTGSSTAYYKWRNTSTGQVNYNIGYGASGAELIISFNSSGTVTSANDVLGSSWSGWYETNCSVGATITNLYATGRAFNFIGSSLASAAAPSGGIQFNNGSGVLAGDTSFIWDNTNKRLGIGTATPSQLLEVRKDQAGAATIAKVINANATSGSQARFDLATVTANAYSIMSMTENGGGVASFEISTGDGVTNGMYFTAGSTVTNQPIIFRQATNERMRINSSGAVGIGTNAPVASALLDITSTAKGFLPPRMTTAQRDAIASPVAGLEIYNTTTNAPNYYNGTAWSAVGGGGSSQWTTGAGNVIYYNTANVGIGTATPAAALDVVGDIQYTGVITDISDKRLKTNINPLADGSLEKILKLRPVSFNMKSDLTALEFGFIAQEVEDVFPDLVKTAKDKDQTKSVNYIGLIAPLVKSVQELNATVQDLKRENELLKARLNSIETKQIETKH